jgi:hypothetical protein
MPLPGKHRDLLPPHVAVFQTESVLTDRLRDGGRGLGLLARGTPSRVKGWLVGGI